MAKDAGISEQAAREAMRSLIKWTIHFGLFLPYGYDKSIRNQ
jgi:hypothetical protein